MWQKIISNKKTHKNLKIKILKLYLFNNNYTQSSIALSKSYGNGKFGILNSISRNSLSTGNRIKIKFFSFFSGSAWSGPD